MKYLLVFILTAAVVFAQQSEPLPAENSVQEAAKKDFLLSFSGVLCASNHSYLNKLEVGNMSNRYVVQQAKEHLDEWWGITDRDSFLDCAMSLVRAGHRAGYEEQAIAIKRMTLMDFTEAMKEYSDNETVMYRIYLAYNYNKMFTNGMLLSWDLTRVVYLVRNAYTAGYITESEAWRILEGLELEKKMKAKYKSWEETGSAEEMIANCDELITRFSSTAFVGIALGKQTHSDFEMDELRRLMPIQNNSAALNIANICRGVLESV